ncbi:hypothetical protein P154DRAFT_522659 [Amniculicola lignicola CBS 123094]|uniref:Uncharacterized protein n=1 Tax=Amniculicola lignicola CBS 123094 TaxID=1392246 RepID=A0A6A5WJZ5_9PLEO|nr:hypothetical protein P154DRAFT_522659 [Amniculicola lignicola CBS 123094]
MTWTLAGLGSKVGNRQYISGERNSSNHIYPWMQLYRNYAFQNLVVCFQDML